MNEGARSRVSDSDQVGVITPLVRCYNAVRPVLDRLRNYRVPTSIYSKLPIAGLLHPDCIAKA